ncbi:MAG: hypothetical protein KJ814_04090, partial [Proteobacteria bacterium]|nr:hypothetical protein [Pseudomonadota bacterium]
NIGRRGSSSIRKHGIFLRACEGVPALSVLSALCGIQPFFFSVPTINILGRYFQNFRAILLHFMKNEKRKLHHKINIIEFSPLGILC